MPSPHADLLRTAARWSDLAPDEAHALTALFRVRTLRRREPLVLPGGGGHEVLFVAAGLLRFYYADDDGEATKAFVAEGDVAGPLVAESLGLPTDYGVEALEPTTLLAAPAHAFRALVATTPALERLGHGLTARLLQHKEQRVRSLLRQDARGRYEGFLETHGALAERIPLRHVASYLGISDVHLSRVRRAMAGA